MSSIHRGRGGSSRHIALPGSAALLLNTRTGDEWGWCLLKPD